MKRVIRMPVEQTINRIVDSLKDIKGVEAIVLGGSRARGNYTSKSDIDIGIYYSDDRALDLEKLSAVATQLDDTHRTNLITNLGEWGPWINGGGWITIDNMPTDFLLRDLNKVASVIDDCLQERITIDYQPGHPHGFVNAIYAAETYYCKILWAAADKVFKLKEKITHYPASIQRGIVNKFLWEAGFFLIFARKSIARKDVVYASGCFYRIAACLLQVLYAINKTYIMNENGALDKINTLTIMPPDFRSRIDDIFNSVSSDPDRLGVLIERFTIIVKEVEDLASKHCGWKPSV